MASPTGSGNFISWATFLDSFNLLNNFREVYGEVNPIAFVVVLMIPSRLPKYILSLRGWFMFSLKEQVYLLNNREGRTAWGSRKSLEKSSKYCHNFLLLRNAGSARTGWLESCNACLYTRAPMEAGMFVVKREPLIAAQRLGALATIVGLLECFKDVIHQRTQGHISDTPTERWQVGGCHVREPRCLCYRRVVRHQRARKQGLGESTSGALQHHGLSKALY